MDAGTLLVIGVGYILALILGYWAGFSVCAKLYDDAISRMVIEAANSARIKVSDLRPPDA